VRGPAARAALLVGGWTLYALLFAAQGCLDRAYRGEPVAWAQTLAIWLACGYAWALITPGVLWLAARFPLERPGLAKAVVAHAAGGAVAVSLNLGAFALVAPLLGVQSAARGGFATFTTLLVSSALLDLLVYWVLVGGAQLVRVSRAARERERRALQLEARLSEARLLALRAQLQPHFLFNTLNTVSVLMREDVDAADRVLVLLSGLLRKTLDRSEAHEVPLRDEIAFLETYLEIERTRFADRLSYRVDVDPEALDARVPSLILQPLVENAIRHGVARRATPGCVEISARRRGSAVALTVRDDGPGMAEGAEAGVGLSNTRSRLEQLYGGEHTFDLASGEAGGLVVSLAIPFTAAEAS
jgi:signal transduction histidine kinase